MPHVSDRVRNPFDTRHPCDAVPGYGYADADFHVVGDNPRRHGGVDTGVPFTAAEAGEAVQDVLHEARLVVEKGDEPVVDDVYLNYLYPCVDEPTEDDYNALERYFDAELRAVNAHVLVGVGERASRHLVDVYTTLGSKLGDCPIEQLHADEIRGSGFLVVPLREPTDWTEEDRRRAVARLQDIRGRDYRQTKGVPTKM
ncbi:MAG: uracil-DNA glycosylase family protein [Halobacteriota archaeon]